MDDIKSLVRLGILPVRRWRRHIQRKRRELAEHTLVENVGLTVQSGPFAGMKLITETAGLGPKLLGCFEREVWPAIAQIAASSVRHVVNVGAAEGYYLSGLLRQLPAARGTAFEAEAFRLEGIRKVAQLNRIDATRIEVFGRCDAAELQRSLQRAGDEPTVVIIDVEGDERHLLDPSVVPALRQVAILVEVHDFVDPHISTLLRDRFRLTHGITTFRTEPRRIEDLPGLRHIPRRMLRRLMEEGRPTAMEWFWMEPGTPQSRTNDRYISRPSR